MGVGCGVSCWCRSERRLWVVEMAKVSEKLWDVEKVKGSKA